LKRNGILKRHLKDAADPIWAEPFHDSWMAGEGVDFRARFARAQAAEMAAAEPYLKPGELVIGNNALRPVVTGIPNAFRTGVGVDWEYLQALREERPEDEGKLAAIGDYWKPWMEENGPYLPMTCHASLAYERVIDLGIDGMREHVQRHAECNTRERPERAAWYGGLLITLDGVSAFIEAHARAADRAAEEEQDVIRQVELERIAKGCHHVAHGAPRTFIEAVQLFYLVFYLCGHDSPGPIDRCLYPPLKRDLDNGAVSLDEAQEIVDCLWFKFEEKTAYGTTVGGQLRDGSDATNELSFLCIDAIRRLRLLSPRTAVRWHRGLSRKLYVAACECIATGPSLPALVNDETIIPGMLERGIRLEDARDYTFVGCGQTYPHGRGHGNYEDVIINSAKPLELALNNGIDPMSGERLGPETGAADTFTSFDEFLSAYRRQMDHHISQAIHAVNERRLGIKGRACDFLRSLFTYSCVETGLDWHAGGADYSEGMVDMVGLTTATDSLLAIKEAVFEEQRVSLAELVDILNRNWESAEDLRLCLLRALPKFGNGAREADSFTVEEFSRVNEFIKSHKTAFGGPWGMDIIGWSGAVLLGGHTGATADGRRRGEALADCAGPAQGRNVQGLTTTLNSVLQLPHSKVHGPLVLSLRFPKESLTTAADRAKFRALVESYLRRGGQQLQISIASAEEMQAAQQTPDAYADLMVRVGGFSAYFTQLEKCFQDDMIARAEMEV